MKTTREIVYEGPWHEIQVHLDAGSVALRKVTQASTYAHDDGSVGHEVEARYELKTVDGDPEHTVATSRFLDRRELLNLMRTALAILE